jgi:hypothetical protein
MNGIGARQRGGVTSVDPSPACLDGLLPVCGEMLVRNIVFVYAGCVHKTSCYFQPYAYSPFSTDAEVVRFAKAFLREHSERFRKDIKICLTRDNNKAHAYLPALISCISFADLLSGLYAGRLDGHGVKELKNYAGRFMGADYTQDRVDLLYECFRHKIAHLAQPYAVFDTLSKPKAFRGKRRLITWTVRASGPRPPIEIVAQTPPKQIRQAVTPWPVQYDHRVFVSVRGLASDVEKSAKKYLCNLAADATARENFKKCMLHYFPR